MEYLLGSPTVVCVCGGGGGGGGDLCVYGGAADLV